MSTTEIVGYTELTSALSNKFITYNRNLRKQEGLERVLDRDLVTSPVSPASGDNYIMAGIGGDWSSSTIGYIAHYYLGAWHFYAPFEGLLVYITDEDLYVKYTGSAWVEQAFNDLGLGSFTDYSIPFLESGALTEDTNLNYNNSTDVLSAPNITVSSTLNLTGYTDTAVPYINSGVVDEDTSFNYDYSTQTLTVPNLVLTGTSTSVETTNMNVTDSIVSFADGNATDSLDIGFIGERLSGNVACFWDESADEFVFANTSSTPSDSVLTISSYANFKANNINAQGTLTAVGATTLAGMSATTGSFSSTLGVTGLSTLSGGLSTSTGTFSSTITVTGLSTLNGGLSVAGTGIFDLPSSGTFSILAFGGASALIQSSGALGYNASTGNSHIFQINSTQYADIDASSTTDDTSLSIRDATAGSLKRVSRGAADSGGTGYRVLRIPN